MKSRNYSESHIEKHGTDSVLPSWEIISQTACLLSDFLSLQYCQGRIHPCYLVSKTLLLLCKCPRSKVLLETKYQG